MVRAGALAAKMPLRNAPPETVPGRMRAVATKACRLAPPAKRTCRAGFAAADNRGGCAGPARYGCEAAAVAWSPWLYWVLLVKGRVGGSMNVQGVPCLKLPQAILRPRRAGRTERQPGGSVYPRGAAGSGRTASVLEIGRGVLVSRPVPEGRPPEDKAAAAVPPAGAREACERVAARPAEATPGIRRRRERSPKKPPADAIFRGCRGCQGSGGWRGWRGKR